MLDPYPRKLLLGPKELMQLLSLDRTTWYEFLRDPTTGFPRPVEVGRTPNGKPRLRWRKWQVAAWLEGLKTPPAGAGEDPGDGPDPPPEGGRRKS